MNYELVMAAPQEPARQFSFGTLAPGFAIRLYLLMKRVRVETGYQYSMFEGMRSQERQAWLYAQGRTRPGNIVTNAPTTDKSHHGYGLGADMVFKKVNKEWWWPPAAHSLWKDVDGLATDYGLVTGSSWGDAPHIHPLIVPVKPTPAMKELRDKAGIETVWEHFFLNNASFLDVAL